MIAAAIAAAVAAPNVEAKPVGFGPAAKAGQEVLGAGLMVGPCPGSCYASHYDRFSRHRRFVFDQSYVGNLHTCQVRKCMSDLANPHPICI